MQIAFNVAENKVEYPIQFLELVYEKAENMEIDCEIALSNDFYGVFYAWRMAKGKVVIYMDI